MYPVLIIREEIVCILILLFLYFMSRFYMIGKDSKPFTRMMVFAMLHVVFDIITILTVNHVNTLPIWVNDVCHIIFYTTAILYANELFFYVAMMCYSNISERLYWLGYILVGIFTISVPFQGIKYVEMEGTYLSLGTAAYVGFSLAFAYFMAATVILLVNFKKLKNMVKVALLLIMFVLFASIIVQNAIPEMLFTGGGITIVTVAFFFSIENPVYFFRQKAMTDALTGMLSRQSYDIDIEAMDTKFKKNPNENYILAFCDINNLKAVNGLFGHSEGDHYITLIASVFMEQFIHADGIYRMGGDEFFVVFHDVDEDIVAQECQRVQTMVSRIDTGNNYAASVAIGYAKSGPKYRSIRDVVRTADYVMYKNKIGMKGAKSFVGMGMGTKLNLTGLTDYLFDAMCSSNERIYPFISNLETKVTRISPSWSEYFGLGFEFTDQFGEKWIKRVHPDDEEEVRYYFSEIMTGKSKQFNCEYRALNSENEYVLCACHGAIYKGGNGEPDVFAGYLINHGVEEKVDAITGFGNFFELEERFQDIVSQAENGLIVLQIRINNAERLDMLYGYVLGRKILREAAQMLENEIGDKDEVFTDKGTSIVLVLRDTSKSEAKMLYNGISNLLAHGIHDGDTHVPLRISGGAAEIIPEQVSDRKTIRRELIFAVDESRYNRHDNLVFVDEMFKDNSHMDFEMLTAIHSDAAGASENFCLRYQPLIETQSRNIVGGEALLRWNSPKYGEVSPGRFIDFLESDPCFYELGLKILRRAVKDASVFRNSIPDFKIAVNVTALQVRNQRFLEEILGILKEENYPADGLILELTERSKELNSDFLKGIIDEIRAKGIKIAFDDMGTGYSTINLLLNILVDEVKLDRAFVKRLQIEEKYQTYAKALTDSSYKTGTRICFEGVETEEMYEFIKQYGNSFCQGFYLGKPMLIDEFADFLNKAINNIDGGRLWQ